MIRLISTVLMMLMLVAPATGLTLANDANPIRNDVSLVSQYPDLINRINPKVLSLALSGYYSLKQQGKMTNDGILTVIDFDRPSVEERQCRKGSLFRACCSR
jgi:hypothetical protein